MYSPIDFTIKQEELVRDIVQAEISDVSVTISKEVANLGQHSLRARFGLALIYPPGLLERENATILNASLLRYAGKVVAAFQASAKSLNLNCPMFLTSNDGTLMTLEQATKFPIKTFSSGPTNSMRGANFLASWASWGPRRETALVVDIGGTTVS